MFCTQQQGVIFVINKQKTNKNLEQIQHIYLNWKSRSKGNVTQYNTDLPQAIYFLIQHKGFQFHQSDSVKQTLLELPSLHSSCDHNLQFTLRKAILLAVTTELLMSRNNEPVLALKIRNGGSN